MKNLDEVEEEFDEYNISKNIFFMSG